MVELINTSSDNSLAIGIIYFNYVKLILLRKERLMLEKKLVLSRNKFIQFYKISRESQSLYRCRYCFPRISCIIKFGAVHKPCAQFAYNTFSWEMILQRELQSIRLNLTKKLQKFLGNDVRNWASWHNNLIYVATSCEVSSKVYVNKVFWSVSVRKSESQLYTTSTRLTLEKTNLSSMVEGWHILLCH